MALEFIGIWSRIALQSASLTEENRRLSFVGGFETKISIDPNDQTLVFITSMRIAYIHYRLVILSLNRLSKPIQFIHSFIYSFIHCT